MDGDAHLEQASAYALGALEPEERAEFELHWAQCPACQLELRREHLTAAALEQAWPRPLPPPLVREQLLDLALAPRELPPLGSLVWQEVGPGIRLHVLREERERGLRACLAWAQPGARTVPHRHVGGDELILVLQGGLRDERGEYHAGDLCHSRAGSVHTEEILPGEDCVAYVLYYGELQTLEP